MRKRTVVAGVLVTLGAGMATWAPCLAADVHIGINIGTPPPPPIVMASPPRLEPVPRLPVYWAPSLSYNFFYHDGRYYTYGDGGWFWSVSVRGPWAAIRLERVPRPLLAVPVAYYKVPPGHWKKHRHGKKHKKHGD